MMTAKILMCGVVKNVRTNRIIDVADFIFVFSLLAFLKKKISP